ALRRRVAEQPLEGSLHQETTTKQAKAERLSAKIFRKEGGEGGCRQHCAARAQAGCGGRFPVSPKGGSPRVMILWMGKPGYSGMARAGSAAGPSPGSDGETRRISSRSCRTRKRLRRR